MSATGSKEFWLTSFRQDASAFRAVALEADLGAAVPTCPGWTVLDLMHHLGGVYRWVCAHVSRGITAKPDPELRRATMFDNLPEPGETIAWWDEQTRSVAKLLESLDPQAPAWNWAPQPKVATFWHRRMAHETALHRWDMQLAATGLTEPIEARLAVDGVGEVLDTWLPAGRRRGPTTRFGVIQLLATDIQHQWFVRLRGEAIALLDTATLFADTDPTEQVAAAGTASDLQLALWGRINWDVLDIGGDETLLGALRTG
jgi:uncharacterized protein (TIGR03083 family)